MKQFIETLDVAIDNLKELKRQAKEVLDAGKHLDTDFEEPKVKLGDYVLTELKSRPQPGLTVYQVTLQIEVDTLNNPKSLYNVKVITKEKFEELRGICFD